MSGIGQEPVDLCTRRCSVWGGRSVHKKHPIGKIKAVASVGVVTHVVPFVFMGKRRFSLVFECLEWVVNLLTSVPGDALLRVAVAPKLKTPKWNK